MNNNKTTKGAAKKASTPQTKVRAPKPSPVSASQAQVRSHATLSTKQADRLVEHVFGRVTQGGARPRTPSQSVLSPTQSSLLEAAWEGKNRSAGEAILVAGFKAIGLPVDPKAIQVAWNVFSMDRDNGFPVATSLRDGIYSGYSQVKSWLSPTETETLSTLSPETLPQRQAVPSYLAGDIAQFLKEAPSTTTGGVERYYDNGLARVIVSPIESSGGERRAEVKVNGRTIEGPISKLDITALTTGVTAGSAGFLGGTRVKSAVGSVQAPYAIGGVISANSHISATSKDTPYGPGTVLRGREVFASLESLTSFAGQLTVVAPGGKLITVDGGATHYFQISPMAFGGRARDFAHLFNRCHVHKLKVRYIPSVGTNNATSVAIGVFDDATYARLLTEGTDGAGTNAVPEESLYGYILANQDSKMATVWTPLEVDWNMKGGMADQENWLYNYSPEPSNNTSADQRQMSAGTVAVVLDQAATTGTSYGHILLEYEIVFADPSPNLSAHLPTQIGALAGPICDALGDYIRSDPVPFFRLLATYGLGSKPPVSEEDEHLLRLLRSRGLIPQEQDESPYQKWLDKGGLKCFIAS
jgi:hypothetical protein